MIGYAFCGSFCTFSRSLEALAALKDRGLDILPIMSKTAYETDTRFFKKEEIREKILDICKREIVTTIVDAEPLGPKIPLDALVIAPCTGNTLAKLASGITDTAVTMAAKAHLRTDRPLLIALASNDAMSQNLKNIARLITRRSVYFVPMEQDDPIKKPHSLVADFSLLPAAFDAMIEKKQMRKMFI